MKRRTALQYLGTLAGAAAAPRFLTGCSPAQNAQNPRVADGITTIVTVCMENRSYDTYFGARSLLEGKPGDGLLASMSNPNMAGVPIPVFHANDRCIADPPHSWDPCRVQFDGGKNDGFVLAYQQAQGENIAPDVMCYQTRAELPVSYALADAGVVCDRWYSALLGPTWPNRMYLHSGQSGGLSANTLPAGGSLSWPSIYDRLDGAKVPWAYYYNNIPFVSLWANLNSTGNIKRFETDFFDDAAAGTLPPVVFIDPAFDTNDDHPPLPPSFGQQFLSTIYAALATSPQWPNILLVITYDEHGGFFDHVPPPLTQDSRAAQGFNQLGMRVPAMVLGPYVKAGTVSSVPREHCSVLAHIEKMFKLQPLTERDAVANDLSETIDQDRLAKRQPAAPILTLPQVTVEPADTSAACMNFASSDIVQLAASGYFPPHLNRHGQEREIILAIARQAERLGVGGVKR